MNQQQPRKERERQLFGTLLASRPARTRSPVALGLSVVLHIAFLGLLVVLSRTFLPALVQQIFVDEEPEEVARIIVPVGGGTGEPSVAPRPRRDEEDRPRNEPLVMTPGPITEIPEATPGPETVEPSEGPPGGQGGGGQPGSLADRLRPGPIDPRLSGAARYTLPPDASPAEAVRSRVAQSLRAYNDSVAAETDARRRALDWTIKTKDGKQWGIGPDGKIHLGDITLPPLVAFTPPAGRRDEINNRNRDFGEIERQANNEIGRQSFNQRVKAIRARKEREREEKKKATEPAPITDLR